MKRWRNCESEAVMRFLYKNKLVFVGDEPRHFLYRDVPINFICGVIHTSPDGTISSFTATFPEVNQLNLLTARLIRL